MASFNPPDRFINVSIPPSRRERVRVLGLDGVDTGTTVEIVEIGGAPVYFVVAMDDRDFVHATPAQVRPLAAPAALPSNVIPFRPRAAVVEASL